jgi:hypothetical protein
MIDFNTLRKVHHCVVDAIMDHQNIRVVCEGLGPDCTDITVEIDGQGFIVTIEPVTIKADNGSAEGRSSRRRGDDTHAGHVGWDRHITAEI